MLVEPDMQGSTCVVESYVEYVVNHGKVILLLVEAIGAYLYFFFCLHFSLCKKVTNKSGFFFSPQRYYLSCLIDFHVQLHCEECFCQHALELQ